MKTEPVIQKIFTETVDSRGDFRSGTRMQQIGHQNGDLTIVLLPHGLIHGIRGIAGGICTGKDFFLVHVSLESKNSLDLNTVRNNVKMVRF